jgi:hypothetical protein
MSSKKVVCQKILGLFALSIFLVAFAGCPCNDPDGYSGEWITYEKDWYGFENRILIHPECGVNCEARVEAILNVDLSTWTRTLVPAVIGPAKNPSWDVCRDGISDHALICLEGCGIDQSPSKRVFLVKSNIQEILAWLESGDPPPHRRVDSPA